MQEYDIPELDLDSGIAVEGRVRLCTDFAAMRTLVESGMRVSDVAKVFKVSTKTVADRKKKEGWLSPKIVGKMRNDLAKHQAAVYKRTGQAMDVSAVKARIWEERGEAMKEKTFQIVEAALSGVSPERAKRLIQNPLGLQHITNVARQITGEEAKDAVHGPQMAVNISFLRSQQPVPIAQEPVVDV